MSDLQITGIAISEQGIEIGYLRLPQDVRKNGLAWQHSVLVPRDSDYDEEIGDVEVALLALLADALDDEDRAEPIDLTPPDEDDDEDEDEA